MASLHAYQQYRWNNQVYPHKCARVTFHYEKDGMVQPAPHYFALTTVDTRTGRESQMGPITRVYPRRPFSIAFVSVDNPPTAPYDIWVWVSYDNDYWHRVPIIQKKNYVNEHGQKSVTLMVTLLRFLGRVRGYNGRLGGYRGLHNVVLEKCGGNGMATFGPYAYDNNDGNSRQFTEPLYRWKYGKKLPIPSVY